MGWIIASGAVAAADHAGLIYVLENAPRVGTAREHWPKLIEAAGVAAMDSTFRAISVPLCDELRLPESRTLLA